MIKIIKRVDRPGIPETETLPKMVKCPDCGEIFSFSKRDIQFSNVIFCYFVKCRHGHYLWMDSWSSYEKKALTEQKVANSGANEEPNSGAKSWFRRLFRGRKK